MHTYYVVYCARTDEGTATGRSFVTRNVAMDTADEIESVEQSVLENARKKNPSMNNLFLTFWTEVHGHQQETHK